MRAWVYSSPEVYSPVFKPVTREQVKQAAGSPMFRRLVELADARAKENT